MPKHRIVSEEQWLDARKEFLKKEKEFTRQRDRLSAERRELPWVKVGKDYAFDGPAGRRTLAELFDGRSQLVVYHFMYGPDWEEGCPTCSFWADTYDGIDIHLAHRDVTLVTVSRAPFDQLAAYKQRMGWRFNWVSSLGCDFTRDFGAHFTPEEVAEGRAEYNYRTGKFPSEEAPGISVFFKAENADIFHTYSCYARGLDMMNGAYHFLDLVPRGRDEADLSFTMAWLRRHDQYED